MLLSDSVAEKLLEKRQLKSLDRQFVKGLVDEYFARHPNAKKVLEAHPKPEKSREYRAMIKELRKKLHGVYGVFILSDKRLGALEAHMQKSGKIDAWAIELHRKLLMSHKSTAERMPHYADIYSQIFRLTGKPKSILDLAAGLNPLSYPWMGLDDMKVRYAAVELSMEDARFLQRYFEIMGAHTNLDGSAIDMNLVEPFVPLPHADVCFLFKALDTLEDQKRNVSKELLQRIDARFIVASFPTKSIGGKKRIRERGWFLRIMRELSLSFEKFETGNEAFYIIKK